MCHPESSISVSRPSVRQTWLLSSQVFIKGLANWVNYFNSVTCNSASTFYVFFPSAATGVGQTDQDVHRVQNWQSMQPTKPNLTPRRQVEPIGAENNREALCQARLENRARTGDSAALTSYRMADIRRTWESVRSDRYPMSISSIFIK